MSRFFKISTHNGLGFYLYFFLILSSSPFDTDRMWAWADSWSLERTLSLVGFWDCFRTSLIYDVKRIVVRKFFRLLQLLYCHVNVDGLFAGFRDSIRAIHEATVDPITTKKQDEKEESQQNWKIKMLYDGDCPLCMREVCT